MHDAWVIVIAGIPGFILAQGSEKCPMLQYSLLWRKASASATRQVNLVLKENNIC